MFQVCFKKMCIILFGVGFYCTSICLTKFVLLIKKIFFLTLLTFLVYYFSNLLRHVKIIFTFPAMET